MDIWAIILILAGAILTYMVTRRWFDHMRAETIRSVWARRTGQEYTVKPMRNSGWWIVAIVIIAAVLILVVAS
jgi:hypothetical protein